MVKGLDVFRKQFEDCAERLKRIFQSLLNY